jgi:hypothetical protein
MLPVSLDCPFALPLRYSLTFICPVSCVYPMLPVSLDCPQDTGQIHVREYRRDNTKGQSIETGNIGYTGQINVREYRRGKTKGQSRETLVYPMLPVSLDCPFALPLRYSLTCSYALLTDLIQLQDSHFGH